MTKPIGKVTVNTERNAAGDKYYSVSGKVGGRAYYRMGKFDSTKEAEEYGKKMIDNF